jgi:hypothetical protein
MHGYHKKNVGEIVVVVVEVVLVDVMHGRVIEDHYIGHLVPLRLHLIRHQRHR